MNKLKIVIPKGRLNKKVIQLLNDIGLGIETDDRLYIPRVDDPEVEAKIMKPQNIAQLVEVGSHDLGFTGYDWVMETGVDVEEVMDLEFNKVKIVAAVPESLASRDLTKQKIIVASEYQRIAKDYLDRNGYNYIFIRTFGATEVFPPDDADMIIDNTSTGRTLIEHNLSIVDTVLSSTTRIIANKQAMQDPFKRAKIDELMMLVRSVMDARKRVMLEMNVPNERYEAIVAELPCMRAPTVSPLFNNEGYAVKVAVLQSQSARLIPRLKMLGATDILEYRFRKVVP